MTLQILVNIYYEIYDDLYYPTLSSFFFFFKKQYQTRN